RFGVRYPGSGIRDLLVCCLAAKRRLSRRMCRSNGASEGERWQALGGAPAQVKKETGNWKLETGNWKLETGNLLRRRNRPLTRGRALFLRCALKLLRARQQFRSLVGVSHPLVSARELDMEASVSILRQLHFHQRDSRRIVALLYIGARERQ